MKGVESRSEPRREEMRPIARANHRLLRRGVGCQVQRHDESGNAAAGGAAVPAHAFCLGILTDGFAVLAALPATAVGILIAAEEAVAVLAERFDRAIRIAATNVEAHAARAVAFVVAAHAFGAVLVEAAVAANFAGTVFRKLAAVDVGRVAVPVIVAAIARSVHDKQQETETEYLQHRCPPIEGGSY